MKPKTDSFKISIKCINLVRQTMKKREKIQITSIRNEREAITTNPMDVKWLIKEYYK